MTLHIWIFQIHKREFICTQSAHCFTVWNDAIIKGKYFGVIKPSSTKIMEYGQTYFISFSSNEELVIEQKNKEYLNREYFTAKITADPIAEMIVHGTSLTKEETLVISYTMTNFPVLWFLMETLFEHQYRILGLLLLVSLSILLAMRISEYVFGNHRGESTRNL